MYTIKITDAFAIWLEGLKDPMTIVRLRKRLKKAEIGLLGDVKPVGSGVFEMREFFGSGYRMYYVQQGQLIIVMLGGGDKSSQDKDIESAIALSRQIGEKS